MRKRPNRPATFAPPDGSKTRDRSRTRAPPRPASPSSPYKQRIRGIVRLVAMAVPDAIEGRLELAQVRFVHQHSGEDAPVRRAVVPVMKQRDRPPCAQLAEERQQRAGALGKLEAAEPFPRE